MRCYVFFFSSRRRHTRWPRDWSSDVCSSDLGRRGDRGDRRTGQGAAVGVVLQAMDVTPLLLGGVAFLLLPGAVRAGATVAPLARAGGVVPSPVAVGVRRAVHVHVQAPSVAVLAGGREGRSEERRVGKEARSRLR